MGLHNGSGSVVSLVVKMYNIAHYVIVFMDSSLPIILRCMNPPRTFGSNLYAIVISVEFYGYIIGVLNTIC